MKKYLIITGFAALIGSGYLYSGELINDVVAVVGNLPITRLEVEKEKQYFKNRPEYTKSKRNIESEILDFLIDRAVIFYTAAEESIIIGDRRIDDALKQEMESRGISSQKTFERVIHKETGFSMTDYREEVRYRLMVQSVLQVRISIPIPEESEVEEWFKKNRKQLGNKYKVRIIRMQYNKNDAKDELRVNRLMNGARDEAIQNFSKAAQKYSDHESKSSGGSLGWVTTEELYRLDPYVNNVVRVMEQKKMKGVSPVFVGQGYYYMVELEGITLLKIDDVRDLARNILFSVNQRKAFTRWLASERKSLSVIIYMKDYQE